MKKEGCMGQTMMLHITSTQKLRHMIIIITRNGINISEKKKIDLFCVNGLQSVPQEYLNLDRMTPEPNS